jgi:hypothetical protein
MQTSWTQVTPLDLAAHEYQAAGSDIDLIL